MMSTHTPDPSELPALADVPLAQEDSKWDAIFLLPTFPAIDTASYLAWLSAIFINPGAELHTQWCEFQARIRRDDARKL